MQAQGGSTTTDRPPEGLLHAAVQRSVRAAQSRAVLVLHLSALIPPAPRPHHRRIARAILDDAALRHGGQVFAQPSGDLALLCPAEDVASVAETLARLFRIDAPRAEALLTLWQLPRDGAALLAYAGHQSGPPAPPLQEAPVYPPETDAVDALLSTARLTDLMQQQTAIILHGAMRPLFREVTFSVAALEARISATGHARADPFLFRHLAAKLDGRMLGSMAGRLLRGDLPMHLNLTLTGVLSDAFEVFAQAVHRAGAVAAVELSVLEACADPGAFAAARTRLRGHGFAVVLDGLSHPALLLTRPEATGADLVKLDWSARILTCTPGDDRALADAIERIGPNRMVLQRAETEAALAWGLARGIRRFQGRHVDAMLAAARLTTCRFADGCTLRQCVERAAATGTAGRAGCRDVAALAAGCPASAAAPA